jgi:hypothetical protein
MWREKGKGSSKWSYEGFKPTVIIQIIFIKLRLLT